MPTEFADGDHRALVEKYHDSENLTFRTNAAYRMQTLASNAVQLGSTQTQRPLLLRCYGDTVGFGAMHVLAPCSEHYFNGHVRHCVFTCLFLRL
jgi:hypothetical protein